MLFRSPPAPPSRLRPFLVLGGLAVAAAAAVVWFVAGPNPCRDATFRSDAFGYCVVVPDGWVESPSRFGNGAVLDGFSPSDGSASILVEAVDLADGTDVEAWATRVRGRDGEAGLSPGEVFPTTLAGLPARTWDITSESADGTRFRTREIVVVRDGIGWRIVLNETQAGFETAAASLDDLLASWRFA